jgi:hypothetical protein
MSFRAVRNVLTVASVTLGLAAATSAQTIFTQWNFNSVTPDANTATGTTNPAIGSGLLSLFGGTTATFASGDASGGSSDPATGDDSAWNTTTYPAAAGTNLSAGVQGLVSTTGFENIRVSFDTRHSNTSSRYVAFQYTLDGSLWNTVTDATLLSAGAANVTAGSGDSSVGTTGTYAYWEKANTGDTWALQRTVNLSSITGANNNPNFGFRMVTAHNPTGTTFVATNNGSNYGPTGTLRFDMLTIQGDPITTAVPETGTIALLGLVALPGVALLRRRK